jgi:hypothetical protein
MSGSQHPLFSNAPITPAAPALPTVAPGSNLAAVMMQPHPFSLPAPSFGGQIPLSSMMQMMKQGQSADGVNSSTPNLSWNPNNPVGTESLGGNTVNQGSWGGNAAAAYLPGYQGGPPTPNTTATGGYQPTAGDASLMATMNQSGALAPQYQAPPTQGLPPGMAGLGAPGTAMMGAPGMPSGAAPGMPSMGAVGTPSVGQPGQFGDLINRLQALYGGGSGGAGGGYGG